MRPHGVAEAGGTTTSTIEGFYDQVGVALEISVPASERELLPRRTALTRAS
jgi:hypothetical protein